MGQEIAVRNCSPHDLKDIKDILIGYPSPTGSVWSEDLIERMVSDALREQPDGVFVAEIGGRVAGFAIVMYRDWLNIAYLDFIQVRTGFIGKGVGHRLIEKCKNWAGDRGARIIYTETGADNERAVRFYKRHGFQITGYIPEYYQKGLDAVILVNRLS